MSRDFVANHESDDSWQKNYYERNDQLVHSTLYGSESTAIVTITIHFNSGSSLGAKHIESGGSCPMCISALE